MWINFFCAFSAIIIVIIVLFVVTLAISAAVFWLKSKTVEIGAKEGEKA